MSGNAYGVEWRWHPRKTCSDRASLHGYYRGITQIQPNSDPGTCATTRYSMPSLGRSPPRPARKPSWSRHGIRPGTATGLPMETVYRVERLSRAVKSAGATGSYFAVSGCPPVVGCICTRLTFRAAGSSHSDLIKLTIKQLRYLRHSIHSECRAHLCDTEVMHHV